MAVIVHIASHSDFPCYCFTICYNPFGDEMHLRDDPFELARRLVPTPLIAVSQSGKSAWERDTAFLACLCPVPIEEQVP